MCDKRVLFLFFSVAEKFVILFVIADSENDDIDCDVISFERIEHAPVVREFHSVEIVHAEFLDYS